MKNKIICGECIEEMAKLPENSVDSIVTDPPYELGFMGKKWDGQGIAYNVKMWKEALRVLKPGGHLLSFGGTRTYHRMACAIEDAGFEIRDCIQYIYGSGFPKSHNVGKAYDKKMGNERKKVKPTGRYKSSFQEGNSQFVSQTATKSGKRMSIVPDKGNSQWEGFGTALKPANEPIVLARKPLSEKTIVENCIKHGTGALDIDGCRIGFKNEADEKESKGKNQHSKYPKSVMRNPAPHGIYHKDKRPPKDYTAQGRFPANVILDEEAGRMLDEQSGVLKSGGGQRGSIIKSKGGGYGQKALGKVEKTTGLQFDKGGASRFFYCAKASKKERNLGCEDLDKEKVVCWMAKESRTGKDCVTPSKGMDRFATRPKKNYHPTVKPLKLMRYLVRLVTPPNGIVLDPFLGSGTTAMAAKIEGFKYIGIEREEDYIKIAKARIKAVKQDNQKKLEEF